MTGNDPIAIVGLGCRFSGAPGLEAFWRLLKEARHGLRPIPADRFSLDRYHDPRPATRGKVISREGGYLDDIRGFDAGLFRISHREASSMDPQHRLLLEVAWEAIEDAGLRVEALAGSRGGVFIGLFTGDWRERMLKQPDLDFDVYTEIGGTRSSAAGRISHAFDLRGPAVAVDAACASSLTAIYLAAQSLWTGETEIAVAGGCNLVLEPETTICFSRSRMLSPDSRCKFGDASADGFVRSDGFGLAVLKPLAKALADGDRIYSVLRAIGANNDARQGKGLYMTPSREGQVSLLRQVWEEHALPVDQLAYIEAHGTGTRAGDPVELGAIAEALGSRRQAPAPLYVGSVKTNIGHAEGAAGIAAFIKVALSLYHRNLPASLHFRNPNPDIPWDLGRLVIPTANLPLPAEGEILAGVSSFGLSGTNAHAVLETPPPAPAPAAEAAPGPLVLPLSAHNPGSLKELAERWSAALKAPAEGAPASRDLLYTAAARRSALPFREVLVGDGEAALIEALDAFAAGDAAPLPVEAPARVAFIFSGQGGQWPGMGKGLLVEPAFRAAFEALDAEIQAQEGWSPLAALDAPESWTIARIQPLIFCVQVALCALWRAWGVVPDAVAGHSMGEVAAAHVAGILDLKDAVRVICSRSRGLARISGQGAMAVVGLSRADAEAALAGREAQLSIAVSNAAKSTVIAGDPAALDEVLAALTAREVFCRKVDVDVASHSPQTEPLLADLIREVGSIRPMTSQVALYSTVDAAARPGQALGPEYWAANMRRPVRFAETTERLLADGFSFFVEMGPHPVLTTALLQTVRDRGAKGAAVGAMRRDAAAAVEHRLAIGQAWARGVDVPWERVVPAGRTVSTPGLPFRREPFWFEEAERADAPSPSAQRRTPDGRPAHPLLSRHFAVAGSDRSEVWEVSLSTAAFPWLEDHRVRGSAVLPGAAYAEIALAVADEVNPRQAFVVEDLELLDTLVVPQTRPVILQVQLTTSDDGGGVLTFHSLDPSAEGGARQHATARLRVLAEAPSARSRGSEARSLLEEALSLELGRRSRNPGYHFGLVAAFSPDGEEAQAALGHRLESIVRRADLTATLEDGPTVVLLRGVPDSEHVELALERIRAALSAQGEAEGAVRLVGALVEGRWPDGRALLRALVQGRIGAEDSRQAPRPLPPMVGAAFYPRMEGLGIVYGPAFRFVEEVRRVGSATDATLSVPAPIREGLRQHLLHPALLDGCFQAAAAGFILDGPGEETWLPVGIRRLRMPPGQSRAAQQDGALRCRTWLRSRSTSGAAEVELDLVVTDASGAPLVEVDGLRLRRLPRPQGQVGGVEVDRWLYGWSWQSMASPAPERRPGRRIWLADDNPLARRMASALLAAGETCHTGATPPAGGADTLVVCFDGTSAEASAALDAAVARSRKVLERLQALSGARGATIWIVTAGGQAVLDLDPPPEPALTALEGLGRVVASERPELKVRMVDLPARVDGRDVGAILPWIVGDGADDELAVRGGGVYTRRLGRLELAAAGARRVRRQLPGTARWGLMLERRGARFGCVIRGVTPPMPARGEILLDLRKAVLWGRGLMAGTRPGLWVAGRVAGVGPGVRGRIIGERVVAFLPPGLRAADLAVPRWSLAPSYLVAPLPEGLGEGEGATAAALYTQAQLALAGPAQVMEGDRVLILGADGEIGRGAVAVALARGARVVAASNSAEGRKELRRLGAELLLDAEGPGLAGALLDLTDGEGVDVILSAGRGVEATAPLSSLLRVLSPGGRIVEIGPMAGRRLELSGPLGAITWAAIDPDALGAQRPAALGAALSQAMEALRDGRLPKPASAAPLTADRLVELVARGEVPEGPVLCLLDAASVTAEESLQRANLFRRDGTYVLSGGTGGLGLALAQWMAERGAGHLVLLSRRGLTVDLHPHLEALAESGATVDVRAVDVADAPSLSALLQELRAVAPPLRGVFHLAAVLDDATLSGQDEARLRKVMGPKILGAMNLHQLTLEERLDHFVLFSSAATTLGSAGQANYAAANAFLDGLAEARRRMGLPGLSLGWGTWAEIGLAAADSNRGDRLEARGLAPMAPEAALEAFERALLHSDAAQVGIFAIDWDKWAQANPRFQAGPTWSQLVTGRVASDGASAGSVAQILAAPMAERAQLLGPLLRGLLAEVLRMPPARLSASAPFSQLGMDSLMTVELRSRLLDKVGVELSPTRILGLANLGALCEVVAQSMGGPSKAPAAAEEDLEVVELDPAIRVSGPTKPNPRPSAVFLTGATGFLGSHVLFELLARTQAQVVCLVRASDADEGLGRLRQALARWDLWEEALAERIRVVPGDLEAPRFGLSEPVFRAVASAVDAVYHIGARVDHVRPYSQLEDANVQGTAEALRLAVTGRPKPLHHVSTLAVFPFTTQEGPEPWAESTPLTSAADPFFAGYGQSKWMAERLVEQARQRGVVAHIYRAGAITGSRHHARSPRSDVIWRVAETVAKVGLAPVVEGGIGLTPADGVAQALVELSLREETEGQTWHLFDAAPVPLEEGLEVLRGLGWEIDQIPMDGWVEALGGRVGREDALYPVLPKLATVDLGRLDRWRRRACSLRTLAHLSEATRAALKVDRSLLTRYLRNLMEEAAAGQRSEAA